MLERVADFVEPTLHDDAARPGRRPGRATSARCSRWAVAFRAPGRPTAAEAVEILTGAARPILDRWFESEQLKATLATDAIIGAMASPSMPGTAYVLFHHVMGETRRQARRVGLRPRRHGRADAGAGRGRARARGAEIACSAEVARILVRGRARHRGGAGERRRVRGPPSWPATPTRA